MPVINLKQTFKMKLKLFISQLENADITWSPCLKEQIKWAADIGNLRKCTVKIKLLHDSFENRFYNFVKEEDCILALINPFLASEREIMKMPRNK